MTTYQAHAVRPLPRIRAGEASDSKILFAAIFPLFFAAGLVARAVKPANASETRKSVFAEAKAATNTCIPFAFMR